MRTNIYIIALFLVFCSGILKAQEAEEQIGTEVINVVKPYTPEISDAFKVKAIPKINTAITTEKKEVSYSIFSVPVASTFTPSKGKAANLKKAQKEKLYGNYASLGFGTFTSLFGEFFSNTQLNRNQDFGLSLTHHSSQGGVENVVVDDFFYDTALNANFTSRSRDKSYTIGLEGGHQMYNWYGIAPDFSSAQAPDSVLFTDGFNGTHSYFLGAVEGNLNYENAILKSGNTRLQFFMDSEGSTEVFASILPELNFEIAQQQMSTQFDLSYLSGSFEQSLFNSDIAIAYSFAKASVKPSWLFLKDDFSVKIGVDGTVNHDFETSETDIYFYPKINASLSINEGAFIAYGGIDGGLHQNTYQEFTQSNPFVSPTLLIKPTDKQYDGFVGLKGKLSHAVSFNLRGSYRAENDKALFVYNNFDIALTTVSENGYENQNSFGVVYDDITTFGIYGALNFDLGKKLTLNASLNFNSYFADQQPEAWNLPALQAKIKAEAQFTPQFYGGAAVFFVGERFDRIANSNATTSLDSYVDVNAHLGYRITPRWSAFVRGNNLLATSYQKWHNYAVLGLQAMGGVTYKFDF